MRFVKIVGLYLLNLAVLLMALVAGVLSPFIGLGPFWFFVITLISVSGTIGELEESR